MKKDTVYYIFNEGINQVLWVKEKREKKETNRKKFWLKKDIVQSRINE